jgi:hypothetical protein
MRKLLILLLIVLLAFGVVINFVFVPTGWVWGRPRVYSTATVLNANAFPTGHDPISHGKVVVLEDVKWLAKTVLLVAHGIVKAGVDFSQLKPEDLEVSGPRIAIRLPAAQITDTYLDEHQTRVVERTTGLLRMFDKDLEQTARQNAVSDIRRGARSAGILKDADERAQAQLKSFPKWVEQVEFLPPSKSRTCLRQPSWHTAQFWTNRWPLINSRQGLVSGHRFKQMMTIEVAASDFVRVAWWRGLDQLAPRFANDQWKAIVSK